MSLARLQEAPPCPVVQATHLEGRHLDRSGPTTQALTGVGNILQAMSASIAERWINRAPSGRIYREPPFPQPDFWPPRRQTGAVKARIEHVMGGHYDVSWTIFQWSRRPFFALSCAVADTGSDPLSFPSLESSSIL